MADDKNKPLFDDNVLGRLLEAAYVVQEHNRKKKRASAPRPLGTESERESQLAELAKTQSFHGPAPPAASASELAPNDRTVSAPSSTSSTRAKNNHTATLAQIVAIQRKMQLHRLEADDSLALIVGRATELVKAGGGAIGILDGDKIRYRAASGVMTLSVGSEAAKDEALCFYCLQTSEAFQCENCASELLVDNKECSRRGIQSMIAVPVFHGGTVVGGLELYYATPFGFSEEDVNTAQLMASLITESLAREEERTWKKSLANERAVMLEALEKLKPNLAALVDASSGKELTVKGTTTPSQPVSVCSECGHELISDEQFCGKCGAARGTEPANHELLNLQSKVASLWQMQEGLAETPAEPSNGAAEVHQPAEGFEDAEFEKLLSESLAKEMPELFQSAGASSENATPDGAVSAGEGPEAKKEQLGDDGSVAEPSAPEELLADSGEEDQTDSEELEDAGEIEPTALAKTRRSPDWSSAASAREFLEQVATHRSNGLVRFLQARRGDLYLALAVILVVIVIRWGIWSSHPASATTNGPKAAQGQKANPDADLPWYDRALINLGLAEAPTPIESKGDPKTPVWVDLRTGLYYCPGTDLYGKTPKGKFETQRSAQLDEFEPASRKACD